MDQLRVALAWMQKHHFWLLSGLAVLLAIGGWYMGTSHLAASYKKNEQQITSAIGAVQQKGSRSFQPNDDVNNKQESQITNLLTEVKQTWQELYQRQRDNVLKWPLQLSKRFRDQIVTQAFGSDIDNPFREEYSTYIRGRFDDLPKIIDANKLDQTAIGRGVGGRGGGGRGGFEGGGEGIRGGRGDEEVAKDYMVDWYDQAELRDELTWAQAGTAWQIWKTQEDLWVYETMLVAIAATNEAKGSDRNSNAAIRSVFAMQVGQPAAEFSRGSGRVTMLAAPSTGEGGELGMEDRGGSGPIGMDGEGGEMGRGESVNEKALYFSGRYIDGEGKPIPVPADDQPLELSIFGTEYKRLPVRLHLEMDQRWVPFLITQLANAPLQIEVQEVRISPEEAGSSGGGELGGGRGGGRGPSMGGGGGRGLAGGRGGGRGGEMGGGGYGGTAEESYNVFDRQPFMKEIVLQGVVYIFNEPDETKLQAGGDAAASEAF